LESACEFSLAHEPLNLERLKAEILPFQPEANRDVHCAPCLGADLIARIVRIDHAGVLDGAHGDALRYVEMPNAFGAFFWVDDVSAVLRADRDIRAFRLAGRAARALRRYDLICHGLSPF